MKLLHHSWLYYFVGGLSLWTHQLLGELPKRPQGSKKVVVEREVPRPPAPPEMGKEEKIHYKTSAEFLYWKRTNGIGFLASGSETAANVNQRGTTYVSEFDFSPGVQVSFGLDLPFDGWDTNLSYSWLHSKGDRNFSTLPGLNTSSAQNFLTQPEGILGISSAGQKMEQTLNFFQFDLGREFAASSWLTLRPFIDVAALYVPLSMETNYNIVQNNPTLPESLSLKTHSHGLGFGGGFGLNSEWKLSSSWSFLGDMTLNAVWEHFKAKGTGKVTNLNTNTTITNLLTHYSTNQLEYLVNIFLGFDWHERFSKGRYLISAYAGWDFFAGFSNYLIGGVGTLAFNQLGAQALLIRESFDYQGLRAGLKFDF